MKRKFDIETLEVQEKELDFLIPKLKASKRLPQELALKKQNEIEDSIGKFNQNRIIRIKRCNVYMLYSGKKICFFNHSNLDLLTNASIKAKGNLNLNLNSTDTGIGTATLTGKDFAIADFQYEINKISIDEIHEQYIAVILNTDSGSILHILNLNKLIQEKFSPTGKISEPMLTYVENDRKILDVNVFNPSAVASSPTFLILYDNETLALLDEKFKLHYSFPLQVSLFFLLQKTDQSLVFTAKNENINIFSLQAPFAVKEIKSFSLAQTLDDDDDENDYRISHLNSIDNRFLCIGSFRKKKDTTNWTDIDTIDQNFYFLDIYKNSFARLYQSESVFFKNDEFMFKQLPSFISYYYERFKLFIIASNQYYQAECYFLEQVDNNDDDYDIFKVISEDDQKIFLPKIPEVDKMSLLEGINVVDFPFAGYEEKRITLDSIEYVPPPLLVCVGIDGEFRTYYLTNEKDLEPLKNVSNDCKGIQLRGVNFLVKQKDIPMQMPILDSKKGSSSAESSIPIMNLKPQEKEKEQPVVITSNTEDKSLNVSKPPTTDTEIQPDHMDIDLQPSDNQKIFTEKIIEKLTHQLKFYSTFLKSSSSPLEITSCIESTEKLIKNSSYEEEKKKMASLAESYITQKDSYDSSMCTLKEKLDTYEADVIDLFNRKQNIDKTFKKISNTDTLSENITTLLNSNAVTNAIGAIEVKKIKEIKNQMENMYGYNKKQIEILKEFVTNFKKFNHDFENFEKMNEKIRMNNKYAGIFKKFKSNPVEDKSLANSVMNITNFEAKGQSVIYESIMKKFEEVFIQFDFKYEKEIKPLLSRLLSENSMTKTQRDNYIAKDENDESSRYYECQCTINRILSNHEPQVSYFEEINDGLNYEDFFKEPVKDNTLTLEQKSSQKVQSKKYFESLLEKIKTKKEEKKKEEEVVIQKKNVAVKMPEQVQVKVQVQEQQPKEQLGSENTQEKEKNPSLLKDIIQDKKDPNLMSYQQLPFKTLGDVKQAFKPTKGNLPETASIKEVKKETGNLIQGKGGLFGSDQNKDREKKKKEEDELKKKKEEDELKKKKEEDELKKKKEEDELKKKKEEKKTTDSLFDSFNLGKKRDEPEKKEKDVPSMFQKNLTNMVSSGNNLFPQGLLSGDKSNSLFGSNSTGKKEENAKVDKQPDQKNALPIQQSETQNQSTTKPPSLFPQTSLSNQTTSSAGALFTNNTSTPSNLSAIIQDKTSAPPGSDIKTQPQVGINMNMNMNSVFNQGTSHPEMGFGAKVNLGMTQPVNATLGTNPTAMLGPSAGGGGFSKFASAGKSGFSAFTTVNQSGNTAVNGNNPMFPSGIPQQGFQSSSFLNNQGNMMNMPSMNTNQNIGTQGVGKNKNQEDYDVF